MLNPNLENTKELENPVETEVDLEIFRHSLKENDPNRPNKDLLLTPEGRELARAKGLEKNPDASISVAGASPMDRAAETALLMMLAKEEIIDTSDSLAEMDKKITAEVKVGKKIYRDERLGFRLDGPVKNEGMTAFKEGWYMNWLVNDSDREAIEKGDYVSTTHLRQAGNIAELVERYRQIGGNLNRLAENKKADGQDFGGRLERYLASHQGVVESFVAEVIKDQQGAAAQKEFISNLKNGWAETEGIKVRILNQGSEQVIKLSYPRGAEREELEVRPETLQKIIKDREEFEKLIQAK